MQYNKKVNLPNNFSKKNYLPTIIIFRIRNKNLMSRINLTTKLTKIHNLL